MRSAMPESSSTGLLMAEYYLSPVAAIFQYFSDIGIVLSGGQIFTYEAGTTTPTPTWTDSTGDTENANPIVLDSGGRLPNVQIWQEGGVPIKVMVQDSSGNPIGPTFDNLYGINDPVNVLSVLADAASGDGADLVANAVRSYDLFSSMRAANVPDLAAGQTLIAHVEGGTAVADSNAGSFYWNATSTATDDGQTVIKPTNEDGPGRYVRLGYDNQNSAGTFIGTLSSAVSTATGTFTYLINGSMACVWNEDQLLINGGSSQITIELLGAPAALAPAMSTASVPATFLNGGLVMPGRMLISSSAWELFVLQTATTSFNYPFSTNGSLGIYPGNVFNYPVAT